MDLTLTLITVREVMLADGGQQEQIRMGMVLLKQEGQAY
jgi:hypothetical protein